MLYVTFQEDVHIDETTQPVDKNKLWVTTLPVGTIDITTSVMLPESMSSNVLTNEKFKIPIYKFENMPSVRAWSDEISEWEEVTLDAVFIQVSSDNYILKGSDGLYLVPKEN